MPEVDCLSTSDHFEALKAYMCSISRPFTAIQSSLLTQLPLSSNSHPAQSPHIIWLQRHLRLYRLHLLLAQSLIILPPNLRMLQPNQQREPPLQRVLLDLHLPSTPLLRQRRRILETGIRQESPIEADFGRSDHRLEIRLVVDSEDALVRRDGVRGLDAAVPRGFGVGEEPTAALEFLLEFFGGCAAGFVGEDGREGEWSGALVVFAIDGGDGADVLGCWGC